MFSQFTRFLAEVRGSLERERIGYCYLDGRTRRREHVLEQFRSGDDPVFLISVKAGGSGLNLTEADYCFLLPQAIRVTVLDRASTERLLPALSRFLETV